MPMPHPFDVWRRELHRVHDQIMAYARWLGRWGRLLKVLQLVAVLLAGGALYVSLPIASIHVHWEWTLRLVLVVGVVLVGTAVYIRATTQGRAGGYQRRLEFLLGNIPRAPENEQDRAPRTFEDTRYRVRELPSAEGQTRSNARMLIRIVIISFTAVLAVSLVFRLRLPAIIGHPTKAPCCPVVKVTCPGPQVLQGDSIAWLVPPASAGVSDSALVALLRQEQRTWLEALKEQNALQQKALEAQQAALLKAMDQGGTTTVGGGSNWLVLVVIMLGVFAFIWFLPRLTGGGGGEKAWVRIVLALIAAAGTVLTAYYSHRCCPTEKPAATEQGECHCPYDGPVRTTSDTCCAGVHAGLLELNVAVKEFRKEVLTHVDSCCSKGGRKPTQSACSIVTALDNMRDELKAIRTDKVP